MSYSNDEVKGKRVRLIKMADDPNPIKEGSEGEVQFVDSIGTLHIKWDNGRTLGIVPSEDKLEFIEDKN